jgi:hypothetical protein
VTVEGVVDFGCCCGVYDSSMRDRSITVVGVVASASTVAASTTVVVVTTEPPLVSSTATPTTTIDDTEAQLAAAEQAYLEAFDAYIAAARDPTNPELRAEIERLYTGPNLEFTISQLDGFVREGWVARAADQPSRTMVVVSPQFLPDRTDVVELIVCEIDSEVFVEVGAAPDGTNALVTDQTTAGRLLLRFVDIDGQWKSDSGELLTELRTPEECAP